MKCKICNSEILEGTIFCPTCGNKIDGMVGTAESYCIKLPVKWMYWFSVVPNMLLTIAIGGANILANATSVTEVDASRQSARWFWVMLLLSLFFKFWFIGKDHYEQKVRNVPVKMWTWIGMLASPVFILGRDKITKHTVFAMILWFAFLVFAFLSI